MAEPNELPHLSVQMRHRIGALEIDLDFKLTKPWTILFGPSGSGKTTILRAIAGLLRPDFANIVSSFDPGTKNEHSIRFVDTDARVFLSAHERGAPLAPQKASLFPHLSVLENLTYGNPGADDARHRDKLIASIPTLFRIDHLLQKRPAELSGGEAQRVSLARAAMARRSRVLLLDEPFTGLDMSLKETLLSNLVEWQTDRRTPILSVTHDIAEAFQLDAEVIKLAEGRVVEQGPVASVLAEERARLLEQLTPAE